MGGKNSGISDNLTTFSAIQTVMECVLSIVGAVKHCNYAIP